MFPFTADVLKNQHSLKFRLLRADEDASKRRREDNPTILTDKRVGTPRRFNADENDTSSTSAP